jgi:UDP-glucose 4-epimerase
MSKPLVIVTGGTGYIGSHTVIELINSQYEVVSLDNFSRSSPKSLDCIKEITGKCIKNYTIDLCDRTAVEGVFTELKEVAGVIHFAAYKSVPESVEKPELYYQNNLFSLVNILQVCQSHKVKNFVFSSSCSVYGDINQLPVSESTPLSVPKSAYAVTKIMGEKIVEDITSTHQINGMCLRYFNPVGAHLSGKIGELPLSRPDNLVPVITQTAIGKRPTLTVFGGDYQTRDGSCVRDFVHVQDIARAHVLALDYLQKNEEVFEIINLGTGQGVSIFEAIKTFETISGKELNYTVGPRREGDVVEIFSDVKKAKDLLGWTPQYEITDMMASAWKWEQNMAEREITTA